MNNRNYVAKNALKYNKAVTHTDKKKAIKKGYSKHKGKYNSTIVALILPF
jgi:hypothetical protein